MKIYRWDPRDAELPHRRARGKSGGWGLEDPRQRQVERIFREIIRNGDRALFAYTARFEGHQLTVPAVRVSRRELRQAWEMVPPEDRRVIALAASRIKRFHRQQRPRVFRLVETAGAVLEQRVVPLESVGIYIPAGRAPLFSTVLMTALPAQIAGVKRIVMISPWPRGEMNPYILTAAQMAGVDEIYKIGGAQGVFALAVGTRSIPRVDKIVGPGSFWVSAAKALAAAAGYVGIDLVAGPSEIVILADGSVPAEWAAADLVSQREHGEDSMAVLVTNSRTYAAAVREALSRATVAGGKRRRSAGEPATLIRTRNLKEAIAAVNQIAPEHLEILMQNPRAVLKQIRNAASIFLGPYSPVPIGDYLAGPNHVLPTAAGARYASPLGVEDFVKRQSVVEFSRGALGRWGPAAMRMAKLEGLEAHARAIAIRLSVRPAGEKFQPARRPRGAN